MTVAVERGYEPGLIGWCVREHGIYYAREWGFGPYFETRIAMEMGAFVRRLDAPDNALFHTCDAAGPTGTLTIDADDAENGLVHLRWFIAADRARGTGVGTALMAEALEWARGSGAAGVFLWTFRGLHGARALYERFGLEIVRELEDDTWGPTVWGQRYEVRFQ